MIDDRTAKILAIMPKCTASISMICSAFLLNHLVRTPKQLSKVNNRLLLCLSLTDALYTFNTPFLTTWMVPRNLFDAYGEEINVFMNTGNVQTCTMQGFIDQLSSKTNWIYNAELAFAYFIAIRYQKGKSYIVRLEPLFHALPITFGLLAAIIPLPYQSYNFAGGAFCWIAASPTGCKQVQPGGEGLTCSRGDNFAHLRMWLANIPLLVTQGIVLTTMVCLFLTVYWIERRGDRYGTGSWRKNTKTVALKCALYVLAFEITWFFNIWGTIQFWTDPDDGVNDPELSPWEDEGFTRYLLNLALLPTYGIWSSIAYFSLPFLNVRKDHPEWGLFTQLKKTVLPPPKVGDVAMSNIKCRRCRMPFWKKRDESGVTMDPLSVVNGVPDSGDVTTVIPFEKSYYDDEYVFSHADIDEDMNN